MFISTYRTIVNAVFHVLNNTVKNEAIQIIIDVHHPQKIWHKYKQGYKFAKRTLRLH